MNDKEITYDELLEACMTQNEYHRLMHEDELNVGQLQKQIETLRYLHMLAGARRRIKELENLKDKFSNDIHELIDMNNNFCTSIKDDIASLKDDLNEIHDICKEMEG